MGEAGQVADDRADARAPPAARRQQRPGAVGSADLDGDLAGELEQVAVEEEEAGELQPRDQVQLLLEPPLGLGPLRLAVVALAEAGPAGLGQPAVGAAVLGAGIAVAEVGGQVEAQPLGQPRGLGDGVRMIGEARGGPRRARSASPSRCRAAPARSTRGSRRAGPRRARPGARSGSRSWAWTLPVATQGTPRTAARSARRRLRVRSPRQSGRCSSTRKRSGPNDREQLPAEPLGPAVVAAGDPPGERPVARAARTGRPARRRDARDRPGRSPGGSGRRSLRVRGVGQGQQPAEVAVAGRVVDQEGQVEGARRAVAAEAGRGGGRGPRREHGQLGPGDRPDPLGVAGAGELHRAPDAVVVGQRHRPVAELGGAQGELVRARGPVEEREGRVGVELDVAHRCSYQRPVSRSQKTTEQRPPASTSSR